MKKTLLIVTAFFFTSCGRLFEPEPPIATMQMSMDGVKLVMRGETRGDLGHLVNQASYLLAEDRRLLIRFEEFTSEVGRINVEGTNKVWVVVTPVVTITPVEEAAASLRLCPITRPWMMLATWEQGHPFGQGAWENPGGDFDAAGCIVPEIFETQSLRFDATQWFIRYPRGRSENFGLILIATDAVTIHGDQAGTFAPRFSFDSYTPETPYLFR